MSEILKATESYFKFTTARLRFVTCVAIKYFMVLQPVSIRSLGGTFGLFYRLHHVLQIPTTYTADGSEEY